MTNDQIQSNTDQNTENKNNNSQVPTNSEVGDHISDTELEPTAGDELAHNIDSEFDNNKKVDLIKELKESNIAMKTEIDKLTKIAATSQSQYVSLKNEFDSYINRIDIEKKEIKLSELKKIVSKFSKLLEQLRLFLSHLDTNLVGDEQVK
jgi:molecular chaperone GrpE (heat shock protein)